MSLSQKHTGVILVPWFNSEEWHYVYHLIYSSYREKQLEALDLLKLWKMRTPILSTGIEGTLILLDALLMDYESMAGEDIANIYAIALMRFLNLSAANADKQGSFTKTSAKNELPKWLINLRHDVAHGHQIPSSHSLKMGLDFGFAWLKQKYWDPQSKIIRDYSGEENPDLNELSNSLKSYTALNMALLENDRLNHTYIESIREVVYRKFKISTNEPDQLRNMLLEIISESLERNPQMLGMCLDELIDPNALLNPHLEVLQDNIESLAREFRDIWVNLLNVFHQRGTLYITIEKLFDIVGNISFASITRKMAALWINEILTSLNNLKQNSCLDDVLKLESSRHTYNEQLLNFQLKVLQHANIFTNYFLDSLLAYNSSNNIFNKHMANLMNAKSTSEGLQVVVGKIHSFEDLEMENSNSDEQILTENSTPDKIVAVNKWKKIENTSMFQNCPLGVLPHQIGQKHPLLVLC